MNDAQLRLEAVRFAESAAGQMVMGIERNDLVEGVRRFLAACYRDAGGAPHLLDGEAIGEVLSTHLPRRCWPKDPFVPVMESIVARYFTHAEESRLVAQIFEIRKAIEDERGEFERRVRMVPENERRYDEEPVAPIERKNVKVGRNDPCPCGSGKKYKQCCQRLGE